MHPLMNRFHIDEQRRLMELLGAKESNAPLVSRRVFLQSAGATGLVIGFGWLAPTGADAVCCWPAMIAIATTVATTISAPGLR